MSLNPCASCTFHMKIYGNTICCGYLLKTGQRRPCEPGEACTVRVGFRRRHYPKRRKAAANG